MSEIVYVDDDPSAFVATATPAESSRIEYFEFDPDDGATDAYAAAQDADIWLFDFFLVTGNNEDPQDENGLSLLQKWRSTNKDRPVTVVVSSDLEKAIGTPLGPEQRHHVVADRYGVEWIGDKSRSTMARVVALADAVSSIRDKLDTEPSEGSGQGTYQLEQLCVEVLACPRDADWRNIAVRQVDQARPPREIPMSSRPAGAKPIVAWLLSHVLPYPSFLLTDAQAALRIGVEPASFTALADAVGSDQGTMFRRELVRSRYSGPLNGFLGRRWWRAGIDDFAWQLADFQEGERAALQSLAEDVAVHWLDFPEPVLLADADLVETDEVADASQCVRATDEDFPASVDPVWVRRLAAREDRTLAAKVVFEDRGLLSEEE